MTNNNTIYKTENFIVTKETENFYGIYEKYSTCLKTHKQTKKSAIKLCNLLQYAYDLAIEEMNYNEFHNNRFI